jgi:hypothetical protein
MCSRTEQCVGVWPVFDKHCRKHNMVFRF